MRSYSEVIGSASGCAVTHGTAEMEFVDLLIADDAWVRQEFDALVAAGWDGAVPIGPDDARRARWPRRPGHAECLASVRRPDELRRGTRPTTHSRAPPGREMHRLGTTS